MKIIAAIAALWILGSLAVPVLKGWELPQGNVASAHAAAALEVE